MFVVLVDVCVCFCFVSPVISFSFLGGGTLFVRCVDVCLYVVVCVVLFVVCCV